jgi:hypothetical protein
LDEIPEPMVIALLRPGHGRHLEDDRPITHVAQILQDDAGRHEAARNRACECEMSMETAPQGITLRRAQDDIRDGDRRECLDHVIIINERGSRRTMAAYVE